MHGWAKNAKKHWPKCEVRESRDSMEIHMDGELLVDAKRDGMGRMVDNQKESHAKYSLADLQNPDFKGGKK